MGEGGPEIGAVDRAVPVGFGGVDVLASRTVELDCFLVRDVGESDGEKWLGVAVDTGTTAEIGFAIFVELQQKQNSSAMSVMVPPDQPAFQLTILDNPREVTMYLA